MGNTIRTNIIIGVDTHKDVHAAAAISALGVHLASTTVSANSKGYQTREAWTTSLGTVRAIGIEGTGSCGAGLSRLLTERGHTVFEVNRPNRRLRHQKGKSDAVDAESAARTERGWLGTLSRRPDNRRTPRSVRSGSPMADGLFCQPVADGEASVGRSVVRDDPLGAHAEAAEPSQRPAARARCGVPGQTLALDRRCWPRCRRGSGAACDVPNGF